MAKKKKPSSPSKATKPKKSAARAGGKRNSATAKRGPTRSVKPRSVTSSRSAAAKKAAATRAKNKTVRVERARKGGKVKHRNRRAREKQGIAEAKIAEKGRRAFDTYSQLHAALERMRRRSPHALDMHLEAPPGSARMWLVLGVFNPRRGSISYAELAEVFEAWEGDATLAKMINPRRIAWIRWNYQKGRKVIGFAPHGGIGQWSAVISEARRLRHPFRRDLSLADVYDESEVGMVDDDGAGGIQVYLSEHTQLIGRKVRV